jgi:hypothetical protein
VGRAVLVVLVAGLVRTAQSPAVAVAVQTLPTPTAAATAPTEGFRLANAKTIPFRAISGVLDTRATPDDMAEGKVRWRQNFAMRDNRRVCRREGFEKLFSASPYQNQDLHDQLLALQTYYPDLDPEPSGADEVTSYPSVLCDGVLSTRTNGREPIIKIQEIVTSSRRRLLFAATTSRIYLYSPFAKNWTLIADGLGDGSSGWQMCGVKETVVFTNNYNRPFVHQVGQDHQGCAIRATSEIEDLATIGLSKASVTVAWKEVVFFMDVTMDGIRAANRVLWGDFSKPASYVPDVGSIAGFQDLESGEKILAALPLGDQLIIYTDRSIWQVVATGNAEAPFRFFRSYYSPEREKTLFFPNAIVSVGEAHIYAASDAIYLFSTTLPEPERIEWIHSSSNIFYDDLNIDACRNVVMGFWPDTSEVYLSWTRSGESSNTRTLVFNTSQTEQGVDVLDHGFSAFGNHIPESGITFGEFILTYGICTDTQLQANLTKTPCVPDYGDPSCEPTSFYNEPEDSLNPQSLSSLCACLDGMTVSDLCADCEDERVFIGASSQDLCLKQFSLNSYYREICNNPSAIGTLDDCYESAVTTYIQNGYVSRVRMGPLEFGKPEDSKNLSNLLVEAYPNGQDQAYLHLRTGTHYQAVDANGENSEACGPLWEAHTPIRFTCQNTLTGSQYISQNLRPDESFEWAIYEQGRFHYIELIIAGQSGQAITGGGGCLSRMEATVRLVGGCT